MKTPKLRRGRPKEFFGDRALVSFRASDALKDRLNAEAKINRRSQSQEAALRLEHSFGSDDLTVRLDRIEALLKTIVPQPRD